MLVSSLWLHLQPPITNLGHRCCWQHYFSLYSFLLLFCVLFFWSIWVCLNVTSLCKHMHLRKAKEIYCILANTEERGNCLHNETGDSVLTMSFLSCLHSTEYTNIKYIIYLLLQTYQRTIKTHKAWQPVVKLFKQLFQNLTDKLINKT